MSKSSKARKRIIKMIRAENSFLGQDNLMIDEYRKSRKDFDIYCNKKIDYYKNLLTNKELLKYYKNNIIPQTQAYNTLNNDMKKMQYTINNMNIPKDVIEKAYNEAQNLIHNG